MKHCISLALIFGLSLFAFSQTIKLTGTVYDPGGALVPSAQIKTIDEKGITLSSSSNSSGEFEVRLIPGLYSIEVSGPGFLSVKHNEFLVVNSTNGKMIIDFVLFGSKYHEPCGVSGGNCLPAKSLIRSYEVYYSPRLKEIRDEFANVQKPKQMKPIN